MILSKFSETLKDLIFDKGLDTAACAKDIGIEPSTLTRFIREERVPLPETLVVLADYFGVTCDFLLGIEPESSANSFKVCPPFGERFKQLTQDWKVKDFCDKAEINTSQYYKYINGKQPTVITLIKIAKALDCSIDFVLGREK